MEARRASGSIFGALRRVITSLGILSGMLGPGGSLGSETEFDRLIGLASCVAPATTPEEERDMGREAGAEAGLDAGLAALDEDRAGGVRPTGAFAAGDLAVLAGVLEGAFEMDPRATGVLTAAAATTGFFAEPADGVRTTVAALEGGVKVD